MPRSPTDSPAAVEARIDAKTGRLICATIGQQLRLDADDKPLPYGLALLLEKIQRGEAKS